MVHSLRTAGLDNVKKINIFYLDNAQNTGHGTILRYSAVDREGAKFVFAMSGADKNYSNFNSYYKKKKKILCWNEQNEY